MRFVLSSPWSLLSKLQPHWPLIAPGMHLVRSCHGLWALLFLWMKTLFPPQAYSTLLMAASFAFCKFPFKYHFLPEASRDSSHEVMDVFFHLLLLYHSTAVSSQDLTMCNYFPSSFVFLFIIKFFHKKISCTSTGNMPVLFSSVYTKCLAQCLGPRKSIANTNWVSELALPFCIPQRSGHCQYPVYDVFIH